LALSKLATSRKGLLFILPALVIVCFIFLNPIFRMFIFSVEHWKYLRPTGFNGFANYLALLGDRHFYETLGNNGIIIAGVVPCVIVISLTFAQAIFGRMPGYSVYTFLFFIPVVMPDIVVAKILTEVLNKVGPLNQFFNLFGLGYLDRDWLGAPGFSLFSIIASLIWKNIGFALLLFLARLTTVDVAIYEAAEIDGASGSQKYFFITIPMLASTISVYVVLQVIGLMSFLFSYIHVMTAGGPGYSSTVLEYFIYLNTFRLQEIGIGSAAGMILIVITMIVVWNYLFASRKRSRKAGEAQ